MAPPVANVYLFNCANAVTYTVTINAGAPVEVKPSGPTGNWMPGTSTTPAQLLLDGTTLAGYFNFGSNTVLVQNATSPKQFTINPVVPDTMGAQIDALQLYLFFTNYQTAPKWALLINGFIVSGDAVLSEQNVVIEAAPQKA